MHTAKPSARSKILAAALSVIRTKGYAATTVDDLCSAAGVTKGAFFHHFKSKDELAVAAADFWSETTGGLFASAPYHAHPDPLDRVLGYIDFRKAILKGAVPEFTCLVGTMVQEAYDSAPEIRDACERSISSHAAKVEADIAEAMETHADRCALDRGKPRPLHAGRAARLVHPRQGDGRPRSRRRQHRSSPPIRRIPFQSQHMQGDSPMIKPAAKTGTKAQATKRAKQASGNRSALSPHLVCAGAADAIEFYKKAFGAVEMMRLPGKDGKLIHACVEVNGSPVMLVDENPQWGALSPRALKGTPVTIHLNVEDVDTFVERAVKAGATVKMPVADMFWGDRYGVIEDPFGHHWSVATHLRDMSVDEIQEAMRCAMPQ